MVVQYDVEAVLYAVVDHLLHAVHPCWADVAVLVHVDIPGTGNTYGTKTLGIDEVDDLLGSLRSLPGRLIVKFVAEPVARAGL